MHSYLCCEKLLLLEPYFIVYPFEYRESKARSKWKKERDDSDLRSNWILRLMLCSVIQIIRYIYFYSFRLHSMRQHLFHLSLKRKKCALKLTQTPTLNWQPFFPFSNRKKKSILMYLQKLSILDSHIKWPMNVRVLWKKVKIYEKKALQCNNF